MPKYYKSCSVCNAEFSRRFNADRHVKNVHGGLGQIVITDKPIMTKRDLRSSAILPNSGALPIGNYYQNQNRYHADNSHSCGGISELIERRCMETVRKKQSTITDRETRFGMDPPIGYLGHVCNTCLNIDFLDRYPDPNRLQSHICSDLIAIDHEQMSKNRQLIMDYLYKKLPLYMLSLVKGIFPLGVKLKAWGICPPDQPVTLDRYPYEHWSKRLLYDKQRTIVFDNDNDNELLDFFKLTRNRTFGNFSLLMHGTRRDFMILIDFL